MLCAKYNSGLRSTKGAQVVCILSQEYELGLFYFILIVDSEPGRCAGACAEVVLQTEGGINAFDCGTVLNRTLRGPDRRTEHLP